MGKLLVTFCFIVCLAGLSAGCTSPSVDSDTIPTNPGIPDIASLISSRGEEEKIFPGCSQVVEIPTMGTFDPNTWTHERTACPHLEAGLATVAPWSEGEDVTISTDSIIRSCTVETGAVANRITVETGATLVIDDADMTINAREIWVEEGASFKLGASTCRLFSNIEIIFHGTKADSNLVNFNPAGGTSKGLQALGDVDIHGKEFFPSWTRLMLKANPEDDVIFLQDNVNWEVGQQILITPTVFFDCPEEFAEYCRPCQGTRLCADPIPHQNEVRTIIGIEMDLANQNFALQLDQPLMYTHIAGLEYQAEVSLLSRRVVISGTDSGDDFGGHTLVTGDAYAKFSGVQAENLGQLNLGGRYPFHMHLLGDGENAQESYYSDCSITNSNFRCIVVHGTDNALLRSNNAFNVKGMCYYLEDGVEEDNTLEFNLAAHVHPISTPAGGLLAYTQGGTTYYESDDLFLPADTSASGFYIPNAYNTFIGNAASGGWSGFAFPNTPVPLGVFQGTGEEHLYPQDRPTKLFYGNTAHSAGFYWPGHGSCFYTGARLTYNSEGVLYYNQGRYARFTYNPDGSDAWMIYNQTKAFLCNKAVAHWGERFEMHNFEVHDSGVAAMTFGEALLHNGLITGRTADNEEGQSQWDLHQYGRRYAMQFYDTRTKTLLDHVTMRNFDTEKGDFVLRYMDHSNTFLPQGLNSVRGLEFENITSPLVGIDNCGVDCDGEADPYPTMASKIYCVMDYDGTLAGTGSPAIIGSNQRWWVYDESECTLEDDWSIYHCNWKENMEVVYIRPYIAGLMCLNTDKTHMCEEWNGHDGSTVGYITAFGEEEEDGLGLSRYPGIAGVGNRGWYWRPRTGDDSSLPEEMRNVDGAPSEFSLMDFIQVPFGSFVVLAVRYPADAEFHVWTRRYAANRTTTDIPEASSLADILNPIESLNPFSEMDCSGRDFYELCDNTGGVGPAWFRDEKYLYLRVVSYACYTEGLAEDCDQDLLSYGYDGAKVNDINKGWSYFVEVTCEGCAVQKDLGNGIVIFEVEDEVPPTFSTAFGATRTPLPGDGGAYLRDDCVIPSSPSSSSSVGSGSSDSSESTDSSESNSASPSSSVSVSEESETIISSVGALLPQMVFVFVLIVVTIF